MSSTRPVTDLPMSANSDPTPGSEPGPVDQAPSAAGQSNPIREAIAEAIEQHGVILFMKGTPEAPACGFSARTVAGGTLAEVIAHAEQVPGQSVIRPRDAPRASHTNSASG